MKLLLLVCLIVIFGCEKNIPENPLAVNRSLRVNLYAVDINGATLVDGVLTNYNDIYSNGVDVDDAVKMPNEGINLSILRGNVDLVVERRALIDNSYLRIWNLPVGNYRFRIVARDLNNMSAGFFRDETLRTKVILGLNDTTYYDFSISEVYKQDRFNLQFKK